SRANQDNSPRINRSAGYENQRIGNVVGARETVGSLVVQKSRIQCYNCKEFGHVSRECQKPKSVKDAAYHREKMLLYAADSGPIFDDEQVQKVSNDDHYNVFSMENEVTNLQCIYLELLEKCEGLETELSKSKMISQQDATKNRGKAIVNSPRPIYDQEPSMVDDDDDETSKDKEIDKLMALISLSFKKIYKPTNNNLRTSSNTKRANQDNSSRIYRNAGYEHQRLGNVAGDRETVGSSVVQKSRIQCYNCKEYRHVARECQKPKRAKDAAYHREKMLLCKHEEAGIQLNEEQANWKDDTDDESDDQELEAHYMYMA
nr:hypothetical protein [Tanacetum cinerariifolium]